MKIHYNVGRALLAPLLIVSAIVAMGMLWVSIGQARMPTPTFESLGDAFYRDLHRRDFILLKDPTIVDSVEAYRDQLINQFGASAIRQSTNYATRGMQNWLGDGVRMRSNLSWDVGTGFAGSLEVGLPLLPPSVLGPDIALSFQTGVVVWTGHRDQQRADFNMGLVGRYRVQKGHALALGLPELIYGGNFFFDINADNDLGRIGLGMDVQTQELLLAINGYIAVDDDWQDGDMGYEERAVSGFDVRAEYEALEDTTFSLSLGGWENDDVNETGSDFEDFQFRMNLGVEWFIHPNLAIAGDYRLRQGGSGDAKAEALIGVQLEWPGRKLGGKMGNKFDGNEMDLYRLVEREQRILYAERVK